MDNFEINLYEIDRLVIDRHQGRSSGPASTNWVRITAYDDSDTEIGVLNIWGHYKSKRGGFDAPKIILTPKLGEKK